MRPLAGPSHRFLEPHTSCAQASTATWIASVAVSSALATADDIHAVELDAPLERNREATQWQFSLREDTLAVLQV
jgi:hypothetical protein